MQYDKDFKEKALKLSDEIGVKKAAEQLGIKYQTLTDWRKIRKREQEYMQSANETNSQSELNRLKKEIAELTKENETLKDALAYLAKERESAKYTINTL